MGQLSETLSVYVMSVIRPLTLGLAGSHGGESGDIMKVCLLCHSLKQCCLRCG